MIKDRKKNRKKKGRPIKIEEKKIKEKRKKRVKISRKVQIKLHYKMNVDGEKKYKE